MSLYYRKRKFMKFFLNQSAFQSFNYLQLPIPTRSSAAESRLCERRKSLEIHIDRKNAWRVVMSSHNTREALYV